MDSRIRISCAALVLAASLPSLSQSPPLTLAEAQRRAVERSRQLDAQELAITASRQMAVAAGQLPDPVLKLQLQNVPIEGADRYSLKADPMTMRTIGVMQEWTRGEKRELRRERYEREADKGEAERSASIATIQRNTALAWLDVHYAQAMARTIREEVDAAQLEIAAAETAYRAGRVSQGDVLSAYVTRIALEDRTSELDRKVRIARTNLARWIGAPADSALADRPPIDRTHLHPDGIEHQIARHPDVEVLKREEEVARTEARLAQAGRKPDWTFEVMYGNRASQFGDMATIGVSIPLQLFREDRQDREIAARLAAVERVRAEREEMERSHGSEIRAMVVEWQSGLSRLKRYEGELVPLAQERSRAALSAYQAGKGTSGELLMARRSEVEVRLQGLQLEMETARLWAQLEFLVPDAQVLPVAHFSASKVTP